MTEINENNLDLPKGWTQLIIENLIGKKGVFCDGDWVESKDQNPDGEVRLIQLADIGDGFFKDQSDRFLTFEKSIELNCTYLKFGDILVARLPDPLGRSCIFPLKGDKKFVTVVDICIIRIANENINSKCILYFINSPQIRLEIDNYKSGSTRKRISRKNFAKIELPIPPLSEQYRIVEKIEELFSELDNGVESLKKAQKQLKIYRQAVLKWAFEGKLTEAWRSKHQDSLEDAETLLTQIKAERKRHYQQQLEEWQKAVKVWEARGKDGKKPPKPQQPKDLPPLTEDELSALPSLPDGWLWVKVGDVSCRVTVGHVGSMKNEYKESGISFLRSQNVRENRFDSLGLKYISQEFHNELEKSKLSSGDVVIVRSGNVGTACVIPEILKEANCSDLVIIKQPILVLPEIFSYYFNAVSKTRVSERKVGVALTHFNTKSVEDFSIPLPSQKEQSQIVQEIESRLSICDQLEATISDNLEKAEALRQSILKQAFEGKLVPQNPEDEPASELLKRLNCD